MALGPDWALFSRLPASHEVSVAVRILEFGEKTPAAGGQGFNMTLASGRIYPIIRYLGFG